MRWMRSLSRWLPIALLCCLLIHLLIMMRGAFKQMSQSSQLHSSSEKFRIVYGTAWKKERTKQLVYDAIKSGFRAIDTAGQPKHYREDLVGEGIAMAVNENIISRPDIFIQTKYSPTSAQDTSRPIPYDQTAPIAKQVAESIQSSLGNLGVDHIDSLLLHSPFRRHEDTMEAWHAMEAAVANTGVVGQIGISNIYDPAELQRIITEATIRPAVVQNRFYDQTGFDQEVREICRQHGIMYQSFWTLSANKGVIAGDKVSAAAKRLNLTPEQTFYRFVMEIGITPLSGTTSGQHMLEDVSVAHLVEDLLTPDERTAIMSELTRT